MNNFTYSARTDTSSALKLISESDPASFALSRGRHQPGRPDARRHRAAAVGGRYHAASARRNPGTARMAACASAPWFATATSLRIRLVRERYPLLSQAILNGRLRATAQYGHDRRQSDAANALLLLLRSAAHCNKRIARQRLRCHGRLQSHSRDSRRFAAMHRHASVGHVRRAGRTRCDA